MIVVFDTETTGVDVETDRIVTAFIGVMDESGEWLAKHSFLINPGVPIPEGATAVHGITTENAVANGVEPGVGIAEIGNVLLGLTGDWPLVAYNAPFDLTILDRELRRHLERPLSPSVYSSVIDPLVIDKAKDKYRKGKRTLVAVAPIYGVPVETNAHDAAADCLMAGRIALKMIQGADLDELHNNQVAWKAEQSAGLQEYFRRTDPSVVVYGEWPIKTIKEEK